MKKIRVFRSGKRLKIDFESEPEIGKFLGSTIVKTPFSVSVPLDFVLAEIRKCNPEHDIYVGQLEASNRSINTILPAIFVSAMVFCGQSCMRWQNCHSKKGGKKRNGRETRRDKNHRECDL